MHEKEQWINAIRDNSSKTIASIILADIERMEKQEKEIKRLNNIVEKTIEYMNNYIEVENAPINERIKTEFKEVIKLLLGDE